MGSFNKKILSIILSLVFVLYGSVAALGDSVSQNIPYNSENEGSDSDTNESEDIESNESQKTNISEENEDIDNSNESREAESSVSEDETVIEDFENDTEETSEDDDIDHHEEEQTDEEDTSDHTDEGDDAESLEEEEENIESEDSEADEDTEWDSDETNEEASTEADTSEEEWLEEHGVTETDDGMLEYMDENGDHWEFAPEDPEMFRHISDSNISRQTEIKLKLNKAWSKIISGANMNPFTLILNSDFKYRYPKFFSTDKDEDLPRVRQGIDISRYQGEIEVEDWKTLKEKYGIEFAFIRAGYRGYGGQGSLNEDYCCGANIENAHEAGVAVGIYYFSQAVSESEALEEAEHCLEVIDEYKDLITLPVVTDYEYSGNPGRLRGARLSADEHTSIVNTFCERIRDEGYTAGIYANKSMLEKDMELEDIPDENHIWMANYVSKGNDGIYSTSYKGPLDAWQFSSRFTGFGEGRNGLGLMKGTDLDLDFWYGDFPGEEAEDINHETHLHIEILADEAKTYRDAANAGKEEKINTQSEKYVSEADEEDAESDPMSISRATMTASDIVYSPRPRACRSTVRIYDSDGSRLMAGFDYDRNLVYTYEEDTEIERRLDVWGRRYEKVIVKAGDAVDMKRDIIPVGTAIRVTATGKGRHKDADEDHNYVSAVFHILASDTEKDYKKTKYT